MTSLGSVVRPTMLVLAVFACSAGPDKPRAGTANSAPTSGANPLTASSQRRPLDTLLDSLRRVPASFTEDKFYNLWEFHGDTAIFSAIATYGDSGLARLVEALDDTTPSRATANGRPVPAGVMYNQALKRMAYYEWDCGSDPAQLLCAGFIRPNATNQQLRAAKRAWREAFARGILLRTK